MGEELRGGKMFFGSEGAVDDKKREKPPLVKKGGGKDYKG